MSLPASPTTLGSGESKVSVVERWRGQVREGERQRIVLADEGDLRAREAADVLTAEGLAEAFVAGQDFRKPSDLGATCAGELLSQLSDPTAKRPVDANDPLSVGAALVNTGWAAACVAGASRSTADVLRAGLRVIGLAPGVTTLSSSMLMVLADGRLVVFADCAVLPDPNVAQLAQVAIASADTFTELARDEPHVAMLSFSSKGSAQHPQVDKVRDATELAKKLRPSLKIDGELQFDAAWLPEVAKVKAPDSEVAGRANVFIFPDLGAANISYKVAERLAGAHAYGPLLQGLDGVLHDLSRGCSAQDIVNIAVIALVQASRRNPQAGVVG